MSDHYKFIFMDIARILVAPIRLESLLIIHTYSVSVIWLIHKKKNRVANK